MTTITLHNLLPEVFLSIPQEQFAASEVWLCERSFERGNTYLIEAASGTGKTSLCSFIYGRRGDYSGQLCFDNTDIRELSDKDWDELHQYHLAQLYQEMRLFPGLTAWENIQLKNQLTNHLCDTEILSMLEMLGIADKTHQSVGKLSIGQQQRVALIRSLAQPFDFLLLDEPVSHLDESSAQLMANLVQQEAQRQGAAIIATSIGKRLPLTYDTRYRL